MNGSYDERFEAIYRTQYGRVWRYFRGAGIADGEAHDLSQDTFKRLYERMDRIRNDDPGPFLAKIAKSILLNYVRAGKTQKRNAPIVDIDDPELNFELTAPPESDYAERQADEARRERLHNAIAALPQGQRDCLRLQLESLQYDEIMKVLGISLDAVRSRLRDAKRTLRQQLGEKP